MRFTFPTFYNVLLLCSPPSISPACSFFLFGMLESSACIHASFRNLLLFCLVEILFLYTLSITHISWISILSPNPMERSVPFVSSCPGHHEGHNYEFYSPIPFPVIFSNNFLSLAEDRSRITELLVLSSIF